MIRRYDIFSKKIQLVIGDTKYRLGTPNISETGVQSQKTNLLFHSLMVRCFSLDELG